MFIILNWIDLSDTISQYIIVQMLKRFNIEYTYQLILNIKTRFSKRGCKTLLYYEDKKLEGVCIYWTDTMNQFIYLDKFFSVNLKPGIGKKMLALFINVVYLNNRLNNIPLLWRASHSVSVFYLKHPEVIKYFNYKIYNKDIIYLGVGKHIWEYDDIYSLKLKSCFDFY